MLLPRSHITEVLNEEHDIGAIIHRIPRLHPSAKLPTRQGTNHLQLLNNAAVQILIHVPILQRILRRLGRARNTGIETDDEVCEADANFEWIHAAGFYPGLRSANSIFSGDRREGSRDCSCQSVIVGFLDVEGVEDHLGALSRHRALIRCSGDLRKMILGGRIQPWGLNGNKATNCQQQYFCRRQQISK